MNPVSPSPFNFECELFNGAIVEKSDVSFYGKEEIQDGGRKNGSSANNCF